MLAFKLNLKTADIHIAIAKLLIQSLQTQTSVIS